MSSCRELCYQPSPCWPDICPDPCAVARNEPCITSCGDSTAVVYPPPVSVLFPGPILSTLPQHSVVGSTLPAIPYGARSSSGGGILGGSLGYGGGYDGAYGGGYGGGIGAFGYGGLCGYGKRYGRRCYPYRCGPCWPC
uniref:Keratin n=1 Tax=Pelodiscus sinensis TaxID=13735 RepID=K7F026_PELSI